MKTISQCHSKIDKTALIITLFTIIFSLSCTPQITISINATALPADLQTPPQPIHFSQLECQNNTCQYQICTIPHNEKHLHCLQFPSYTKPGYGEAYPGIQILAFSPDNRMVALAEYTTNQGTRANKSTNIVTIQTNGTNRREYVQLGTNVNVLDLQWSPDGTKLAFTIAPVARLPETAVGVLDLTTGKLSKFEFMSAFSWAPDSQQIVLTRTYSYKKEEQNGLFIASIADTQLTPLLLLTEGSLDQLLHPSWSANGKEITYIHRQNKPGAYDTHCDDLYMINLKTSYTTLLASELELQGVQWLEWSPNEKQIALIKAEQLFIIEQGTVIQQLPVSNVSRGEWSDNAKAILLIPSTCPGNIRWINIITGEQQEIPHLQGCGLSW